MNKLLFTDRFINSRKPAPLTMSPHVAPDRMIGEYELFVLRFVEQQCSFATYAGDNLAGERAQQ